MAKETNETDGTIKNVIKTPNAGICEGPNCPLCTKQGLATYLFGLIIGLYAPWPYNLLGVPIMLLSFVAAGWRPKLGGLKR